MNRPGLHDRHAGRVPDVRQPPVAADAALVGLWQEFQQAEHRGQAPGRRHERAAGALFRDAGARERRARARSKSRICPSATAKTCPISTAASISRSSRASASRSWARPARGKSTLAKLLQGFYQPVRRQHHRSTASTSAISSANELRQQLRRRAAGDVALFSGTIYDNLMLANPHAAFDDVVHGVQVCRNPRNDRKAARGLPDPDRRARRGALGRTEAAHRDRTGAAQAAARY